jgi:hypothetical protein
VARPELIDHLAELGVQRAYGDAVAPTLSFERLLPWLGARLADVGDGYRRRQRRSTGSSRPIRAQPGVVATG